MVKTRSMKRNNKYITEIVVDNIKGDSPITIILKNLFVILSHYVVKTSISLEISGANLISLLKS